jgi:nucleoside-diphosphate-sugar epimerase
MTVFITGGHGHIASWTARYLASRGERIILYDTNPAAPAHLEPVSERITFIKGDVLDFPRLTDVFGRYKQEIDGIIHTVGVMGELVLENPHANARLNIMGTLNMLEIARLFEIPKMVYTSTGAVYGAVDGIAAEDDFIPNPSDLYGATKTASEYLGRQYAASFGLDFRISRVYFCYGPGRLPSGFIRLYKMAFGALEGLADLHLDRGADQRLDFTYIEDAARGTGMLYAAQAPAHSVYNIATGISTRVGRVAELSRKHSAFEVDLSLGPGTLMQRCEALDIGRARTDLGYEPEVDIEEGIQRYARWMQEMRGMP